jgi:hypothetical protein
MSGTLRSSPEADNHVLVQIDALESFQQVLCPVYAFVSATTFCNTDTIIRIIRIIDLDQPIVIAGMELSEPKGESPLLTHATKDLLGPANSLFPQNNIPKADVLWMTTSFSVSSTMGIFQAKSFVTGVISVSLGSASPDIRGWRLRASLPVRFSYSLLRMVLRTGIMIH